MSQLSGSQQLKCLLLALGIFFDSPITALRTLVQYCFRFLIINNMRHSFNSYFSNWPNFTFQKEVRCQRFTALCMLIKVTKNALQVSYKECYHTYFHAMVLSYHKIFFICIKKLSMDSFTTGHRTRWEFLEISN